MFKQNLINTTLSFILVTVLFSSCGEDVILTDLDFVSNITVSDNGNEGNATDIEVNFDKQPRIQDVASYQISVIKSAEASGFTLTSATSLESSRYVSVNAEDIFPLKGKTLNAGTLDTEGDAIREGVPYRIAVVSFPNDEMVFAPVLNISTDEFILRQNNQVTDYSKEMTAGNGSLAIDPVGNVFMADYQIISDLASDDVEAFQIHQVNTSGETLPFASTLPLLGGNFIDQYGLYYQSLLTRGSIITITPTGEMTTFALENKELQRPDGIYVNSLGEIFVIDVGTAKVIKVSLDGSTQDIASLGGNPRGITGDSQGNLYVSMNEEEGRIVKVSSTGEVSTLAQIPTSIPPDYTLEYIMWVGYLQYYEDHIYVAGTSTDRIYRIDMSGEVSVFAGSGTRLLPRGGIQTAHFNRPVGIAFSKEDHKMYVSGCLDIAPQHTQASTPSRIYQIDLVE